MVTMVRDGALSPVDLVQAHLQEIEARNPALNAFVTVLPAKPSRRPDRASRPSRAANHSARCTAYPLR